MKDIIQGPITIAGSIVVDQIIEIDKYPACGELAKISRIDRNSGGAVPNVAIDLKKIVPDADVRVVGRVGDDENGRFAVETMAAAGVDVSGLIVDKESATSFTDVMSVTGGQRTFFNYPGACARFGYDDIDFDRLEGGLLHLAYFLILDRIDKGDGLRILREAKERGVRTAIDLVSENTDRYSLVLPCLPYTDYLIINEYEAGKLTGIEPENAALGEIARCLMEAGVRRKVIIHQPELSVCLSSGVLTVVPSFDIDTGLIKGTTGAGDAFCAGALLGICRGWDDRRILEFASSCAAASLRSADATGGLASEEAVLGFCSAFKRKTIQEII